MNCQAAQSHLMALLDGELTEQEQLEIERHLSECADCRREQAHLTQTLALADSWEVDPAAISVPALLTEIEGASLQELLREMKALKTEVRQLRAEVAALRGQRRETGDAWKRPPVLMPAATRTTTHALNLV